jgi:hypothetical protein
MDEVEKAKAKFVLWLSFRMEERVKNKKKAQFKNEKDFKYSYTNKNSSRFFHYGVISHG